MRIRVGWVLCGVVLVALSACAGSSGEPAQATQVPQEPAENLTARRGGEDARAVVFQIQAAESQARFVIGEILGGQPNTVIGVNDQVQGQVTLNTSNPDASQIGAIEIGASSFVTDSDLRNRAIRQFILQAGDYPVITFRPTSISGLPDSTTVGQPVQLEISGDLTIRGFTRPVTFAAQVTLAAENRLQGTASATIQRADFDLTIPQVPRVAGVDEAVILEFDFVALTP